jgi:hypothetical protein
MRLMRCLSIGLAAAGLAGLAGLAGCTGVASQPSAASTAAPAAPVTSTAAAAAPVSHAMQAGARAAAAQFYGLYSASRFASAWNLLSPDAKSRVSKGVWTSVHEACPGAATGKSRVIKAVTAFGTAAIVTEAVTGAAGDPGTAEDVFNYANGRWSYSPGEVGIYAHGSAAADVAAAKAAGFCTGWKVF